MYWSNFEKIKFLFYKFGVNNIRDIIRMAYFSSIKPNRRRFAKNGQFGLPSEITWELTYRCNLNCNMCFQKRISEGEELKLADIQKIVTGLNSISKKINLTGGEIFVRDDIFEILHILEKRNVKVFIITNGTLLNQEKVELLLKFRNIIGIQFSIDGSKQIHDKIRRLSGAFDKTCEVIKLINNRMRVSIACVIMPENIENLTSVLKVARDLKIRNVGYTFEYFNTNQELEIARGLLNDDKIFNVEIRDSYSFNIMDIDRKIKELRRIAHSYGVGVLIAPQIAQGCLRDYLSQLPLSNLMLTCRDLRNGRLDPYGNVIFCQSLRKNFGNLTTKSFPDIWNSEEFIQFRKKMIFQLSVNPICRRCCKLETI